MKKNTAIDINGNLLHKVGIPLEPHNPRTISTLKYPKTRIDHSFLEERLLIEIPSFLAVELYRKGIFPQQQDTPIAIKLDGVFIGSFLIQDVIYPNDTAKNSIQFKLAKL